MQSLSKKKNPQIRKEYIFIYVRSTNLQKNKNCCLNFGCIGLNDIQLNIVLLV